MSDSEVELVRRARAGDKAAFADLLERHQPLMRRVCRRLLGTGDGLEDVAQEVALQALLGLDSLRDPRRFGPWLAGIGLNVARRALRRTRALDVWSLEALTGGRLLVEPVEDSPGPLERVEAAELSRTVRAAVADLPPGQRAAVLLVYLSGLSYRETAAALGVEVGAVKTRLHKGRHRLQQRLKDLWIGDSNSMTTEVKQQLIEMRVADVQRRLPQGDTPTRSTVVLEEIGGTRELKVWVGNFESDSIAMLLEKVKVPRPLTHAFAANLLRAAGIRVPAVQVHRLAEETYYAQVVLEGPGGQKLVDARPSDCIALALELGASIYVAEEVVTAAAAAQRRKQEAAGSEEGPQRVLGAAEIVTHLLEHWPSEPKPVR